jgi:hypothetical protein
VPAVERGRGLPESETPRSRASAAADLVAAGLPGIRDRRRCLAHLLLHIGDGRPQIMVCADPAGDAGIDGDLVTLVDACRMSPMDLRTDPA